MKHHDVDWVGLWYEIGKERGLNDVFTLAQLNTMSGSVEWHDFSHSQMDGIGAMGDLQRRLGYRLPSLPASKSVVTPRLIQRPLIFWKALRAVGPQKIDWIGGDPQQKPDAHDFPWVIFSREETVSIAQQAKARKVSQSALMLGIFNAVLLPQLVRRDQPGQWLFPVNLRGAVNRPRDSANHSSAIAIVTNKSTTVEDIHSQIQQKLKGGMHWAAWWMLHIGKIIGVRGVRYLSRLSEKNSHWHGTFTNMGSWPIDGSYSHVLNPDEAWLVAAPGRENYPIGIGCLTWNGRLAVSLKIHPSICTDRTQPPQLLQEFKRRLINTSCSAP